MSDSQRATEIVHQAVEALRLRGRVSRASAETLERLAATAGKAGGAVPASPRPTPPAAKPFPERTAQNFPMERATEPVGGRAANELPEVPRIQLPSDFTPNATAEASVSAAEFSPATHASQLAPTRGSKAERLAAMRGPVLACTKCPHLVKSRTQVVFGVGNPEAELMFVGEAPGADEDLVGEPFVGKAGQLLTKIIETMGFRRNEVYIANVLKCRPNMPPGESGNRKPEGAEMNTCKPYLMEQIAIIQPKVLVGLGGTAMEGLLGIDKFYVTKQRGQWHEFAGIPLMPTFHPSYLLRNQSLTEKRKTWEDMLAVLGKLGREISEKQQGYFLKG
jgi:uracil-DNA glycosylase family 4